MPKLRPLIITAVLATCPLFVGACRGQRQHAHGRSASASASAATAVKSATPDVLALLDGLKSGDVLDAWTVQSVSAVRPDGVVSVVVKRDADVVALIVANLGTTARAPASSERYAVYWENSPPATKVDPELAGAVARLLADRLRKTENRVPSPAGMTELRRPTTPA